MTKSDRLQPRLILYIGAVAAFAGPLLVASLTKIAVDPPSGARALAVTLFFLLSFVADLQPVAMDDSGGSEVSIANIFIVAVAVLFGWQYAVPVAALSAGLSFVLARQRIERTLFNTSMYALAGFAAAFPAILFGHGGTDGIDRLTGFVLAGSVVHLTLNVGLVAGAISIANNVPYRQIVVPGLRQGGVAWAIMALLAALAADLWTIHSWLLVLLAGPLFTLVLYQRSALKSRVAMRDALTDNLTRLGNHRAYQVALRELVEESDRAGMSFSLCLLDVDNFKLVNDRFGHSAGDEVLVEIAALLADSEARAFRFGGDEFALIFTLDELATYREVERMKQALALRDLAIGSITVSAGIASYPLHAGCADDLQRTADGALYWSKHHGKNRSCLYSPTLVRIHSPEEFERHTERAARIHAAASLVRFVDARDPPTASHSQLVSALSEAIGVQLGLDEDTIEQLRLAGLLHDIGKIVLPDAILRAPRHLTPMEFDSVKQHPQFGCSLLQDLDVEPIGDWVLRHHENWDGSGYPHGLRGEEIPLGARIIHVADAFEAITANRPYRAARDVTAALCELRAKAGTQFDPAVVGALDRYLNESTTLIEALA